MYRFSPAESLLLTALNWSRDVISFTIRITPPSASFHYKLGSCRLRYRTHQHFYENTSHLHGVQTHMLVFQACRNSSDVHPTRKWQVKNLLVRCCCFLWLLMCTSIKRLENPYRWSDSTYSLNQSSVLPRGQNEKLFRKIMGNKPQSAGLLSRRQVTGKCHGATESGVIATKKRLGANMN